MTATLTTQAIYPPRRHQLRPSPTWLNDTHSALNRTRVNGVVRPTTLEELQVAVRHAKRTGQSVIPFGGRHAMGSQQFGTDTLAMDMTGLNRVIGLNRSTGIVEVEAGITWPALLRWLDQTRSDHGSTAGPHGWAIAQKQTGADELTLGGALAANVHGRGLTRRPIIDDIESFTLADPEGRLVSCSRSENVELFRHAIGGYGLFGLVYSVRLRLTPRKKTERVVRSIDVDSLDGRFRDRIDAGFQFGDFQFQIDHDSDDFLRHGIFSCYRPLPDDADLPPDPPSLKREDWLNLLTLAHTDKSRGFQLYEEHYHRTDGTRHWSDTHQFTTYVDGYHQEIDRRLGSRCPGSEMISELYVPRTALPVFLARARDDLWRLKASVIYGTVRLIERDSESALAWAREPWACVIFNLCVEHSPQGLAKAEAVFRQLIDRALEQGGSFYLTYHKFARRDQVEAAYPQFADFLKRKRAWDPAERFQGDWYRHHRAMFSDA